MAEEKLIIFLIGEFHTRDQPIATLLRKNIENLNIDLFGFEYLHLHKNLSYPLVGLDDWVFRLYACITELFLTFDLSYLDDLKATYQSEFNEAKNEQELAVLNYYKECKEVSFTKLNKFLADKEEDETKIAKEELEHAKQQARNGLIEVLEEVYRLMLIHPDYKDILSTLGFNSAWHERQVERLKEINYLSGNHSDAEKLNQLNCLCREEALVNLRNIPFAENIKKWSEELVASHQKMGVFVLGDGHIESIYNEISNSFADNPSFHVIKCSGYAGYAVFLKEFKSYCDLPKINHDVLAELETIINKTLLDPIGEAPSVQKPKEPVTDSLFLPASIFFPSLFAAPVGSSKNKELQEIKSNDCPHSKCFFHIV